MKQIASLEVPVVPLLGKRRSWKLPVVAALAGTMMGGASARGEIVPDAVKPLWAATPAKLVAPLQGDHLLSFQGVGPDGNFLFEAHSELGTSFVVVDPKTGRPIKRIATAAKPKATTEWTSQARFLPDGRFLHLGVTRGLMENPQETSQGKVPVGINVRVIDTLTGALSERLIPFDDPSASGMSKGPCSWTGQVCVRAKAREDRLYLSNKHFLAELDGKSLATERSVVRPDIKGFAMDEVGPLQNSCVWFIQGIDGKAGEEGNKFILGELGKPPQEISRVEYGKITEARKIEEAAHPKTKAVEFFARENGVRKELLRREGTKLVVSYQGDRAMEVDLGAANDGATTSVQRCGECFLIFVYLKDEQGRDRQRGVIAVVPPKG